MQSELGEREAALKSALEAVSIYRELVGRNRDAFLPDLASSLNNLGNMQSQLGEREAALKSALEAVSIYRELVGRNRDAFLPDLAMSCGARGRVLDRLGRFAEASDSYAEGIALLLPPLKTKPFPPLIRLAVSLVRHYFEAVEKAAIEANEELLMEAMRVLGPYIQSSGGAE
jgi:tetratricopeptide (TPR) repeat protein